MSIYGITRSAISGTIGCREKTQSQKYYHSMMKRYCNKRYHHHFPMSILPSTILLLTATTIVNSQSIQGYIYWDTNANGILDGLDSNNDSGSSDSDNEKSELENGIIDVTVQVHSCYSTTTNDDDGKFSIIILHTSFSYSISLISQFLHKTPTNETKNSNNKGYNIMASIISR